MYLSTASTSVCMWWHALTEGSRFLSFGLGGQGHLLILRYLFYRVFINDVYSSHTRQYRVQAVRDRIYAEVEEVTPTQQDRV